MAAVKSPIESGDSPSTCFCDEFVDGTADIDALVVEWW